MLFALGTVFPMVTHTASADVACDAVEGNITSQVFTEGCTSPVGLCSQGEFTGDLEGDFTFVATNIVPNPDDGGTGTVFTAGNIVLDTGEGILTFKDAGAFNPNSGYFSTLAILVAGTGDFAGATGQIHTFGLFIGGCVDCDFQGEICVDGDGEGDDDDDDDDDD